VKRLLAYILLDAVPCLVVAFDGMLDLGSFLLYELIDVCSKQHQRIGLALISVIDANNESFEHNLVDPRT